jgi:hypothetical protein
MKLKKDYVLRQAAGVWVVLPLGEEAVNFSGMLKLNDSGVMLWRALEQGGDKNALVETLTKEYNVSLQQAQTDVDEFLSALMQYGCMTE